MRQAGWVVAVAVFEKRACKAIGLEGYVLLLYGMCSVDTITVALSILLDSCCAALR
jgi:hypothetical protein